MKKCVFFLRFFCFFKQLMQKNSNFLTQNIRECNFYVFLLKYLSRTFSRLDAGLLASGV